MKSLIEHIKAGKAKDHEWVGATGSVVFAAACFATTFDPIVTVCGFLAGGFITGATLEVGQHIRRKVSNLPQNTYKHAVLDAAATGCWPLILYYKVKG